MFVYFPTHKPTIIQGDNQSALKLATNLVCHSITKHIEIKHHLICKKVFNGSIDVMDVHNKDNVTDIFTKSLSIGLFELFQAKFGLDPKIHFKEEC